MASATTTSDTDSSATKRAEDDALLMHMFAGAALGSLMGPIVFGHSRVEGAYLGMIKGALSGVLLGGAASVTVTEIEKRGWWKRLWTRDEARTRRITARTNE